MCGAAFLYFSICVRGVALLYFNHVKRLPHVFLSFILCNFAHSFGVAVTVCYAYAKLFFANRKRDLRFIRKLLCIENSFSIIGRG